MFVKIKNNNEVDKFPYSLKELREDNTKVSWPSQISLALAAEHGVYPVSVGSMPAKNALVQTLNRNTEPTYRDNQWWIDYEVAYIIEADAIINVKSERDFLLSQSDWVVIKNKELDTAIPEAWLEYRKSLRDIPEQEEFPFTVIWPDKPST